MADDFKPLLFCFCGPTASGKSTICRELKAQDDRLRLSVSTTTREPRSNETDGVDYFFVSKEEFAKRVKDDAFIEHAEYGENSYGTEHRNIALAREGQYDLLLDIEVQGVASLKKLHPNDVVTVFVFPPSLDVLKKRLVDRGEEDLGQMKQRLEIARRELEVLMDEGFSDYLIINDTLDEAVSQARSIVRANRLRFDRVGASQRSQLLS